MDNIFVSWYVPASYCCRYMNVIKLNCSRKVVENLINKMITVTVVTILCNCIQYNKGTRI